MRLTPDSRFNAHQNESALSTPRKGLANHPVLDRALDAHLGDQMPVSNRFEASSGFMRAVRRVGLDRSEVAMTIGKGVRSRRWDGCVLVRDRFLGIEVELDPTGTIGIDVRRVG